MVDHGVRRTRHRDRAGLCAVLPVLLEDRDNGLSAVMRELLGEIGERLRFIDDRLRRYDLTIQRLFRRDERCQRVAAVEGAGPVNATALVAALGNATEFRSGRELRAYLGLAPRHRASGGRTVLLGISKRGDRYLRTLLIHGARSVLHRIERHRGARAIWAARLKLRRGTNMAAVALANKNARMLWALPAEARTINQRRFPPAFPKPTLKGTRGEKRLYQP